MQTQTICDFSTFDPLCLRSLYSKLEVDRHVQQENICERLAADFGSKQVELFESKPQAYAYIFFDVLPTETLFFVDRFVDESITNLLTSRGRKVIVFEHTHYADLQRHLANPAHNAKPKVIVSPSLFLSTSKQADLKKLRDLATTHSAYILIDDSNTMGLTGNHFMGSTSLVHGIDLVLSSLPGATFVAIHQSSTLKAPAKEIKPLDRAALSKLDTILLMIPAMHRERKHLDELTNRLKMLFLSHQWNIEYGDYPTISVQQKNMDRKLPLLDKQGIRLHTPQVRGYRAVTLSLFLHSGHSHSDIDHLFACFNQTLKYQ